MGVIHANVHYVRMHAAVNTSQSQSPGRPHWQKTLDLKFAKLARTWRFVQIC